MNNQTLTPRQEIERIECLAKDLTDIKPERPVYAWAMGSAAINVTVFNVNGTVDWQQNIYDWSHDEAYLPKLRFVRHELETLYQKALAERRGMAA